MGSKLEPDPRTPIPATLTGQCSLWIRQSLPQCFLQASEKPRAFAWGLVLISLERSGQTGWAVFFPALSNECAWRRDCLLPWRELPVVLGLGDPAGTGASWWGGGGKLSGAEGRKGHQGNLMQEEAQDHRCSSSISWRRTPKEQRHFAVYQTPPPAYSLFLIFVPGNRPASKGSILLSLS